MLGRPSNNLPLAREHGLGWLVDFLAHASNLSIHRPVNCRLPGRLDRTRGNSIRCFPTGFVSGRSPGGDDHFRAFRQWGSPSRTTTPLWTRPRISIPAFSVVLSSGSSPPFFSLRSIDEQRGTLNQRQDRLHPRLSKQERPAADSRESTRTIQARRVVQAEGDGPPKCLGRALSKREEPGADERE